MNCSVPDCDRKVWTRNPSAHTCFQHTVPSHETLARVYQAVCEKPSASLREIGYRLHIAPSTVNRALWELDRVGAVRKAERKVARGLVVLPAAIYDDQPYRALWIDA